MKELEDRHSFDTEELIQAIGCQKREDIREQLNDMIQEFERIPVRLSDDPRPITLEILNKYMPPRLPTT